MKKKMKIATIVFSIGICHFGQEVYAGEFFSLRQNTNPQVEQLVQKKILSEQRSYLKHVKLVSKVDLEEQIQKKTDVVPATNHAITTRERAILERIVEAEATGKSKRSKILVANVIFNRIRSDEFPNSVEAVVFQRSHGSVQFSPTADGRYEKVHITTSTKESVDEAIKGVDYSQGALYFVEKTMANPKNVTWFEKALQRLFTFEGHSFYK